jgi:hypothetical protein
MTTDNSTGQPGPMGWWVDESDDPRRTLYRERIHWDALAGKVPARCTRQSAKEVADPPLLTMLREKQKSQGMDDGVDLVLLLKMLFPGFKWLRQLIGSCVASGGMRACTIRSVWEVVILGQPEETLGLDFTGQTDNINHFAPYSYRAGRKIGGINGGDGSFCGAHIQGLMQDGFLPCDTSGLQSDAYPEPQSMSDYRRWGNSNSLLAEFRPAATKFDLLESERVTSADSLKELIGEHFKPMMVCSSWAFRPQNQHPTWKIDGQPVWIYQRDRGTSWAHNMTIAACVQVGGQWYVKIVNSWGDNAHKNGDHFWIPIEVMAEWSRSAEVRTIGDLAQRDTSLPIAW